jgi:hypothetical protein
MSVIRSPNIGIYEEHHDFVGARERQSRLLRV